MEQEVTTNSAQKKTLNHAAVIDCMGGNKQSKTGLVIAIVLLCTVVLSPLGILILIAREHEKKRIRTLQNRLYRLQPDSVFKKYMEQSTDSTYDCPCVILNNYGKMELYRWVGLYDQLAVGDKLYLLQNAAGKVWHIFNRREWELDETAFQRDGNYFYPTPNSAPMTAMPVRPAVVEEMPPQLLLAKKQLLFGLYVLPVSLFAAFALFISAMGTGILGVLGAVVLSALFTWIVVTMLRALRPAKAVDRKKYRLYALGAFTLSGVYILLTVFVCGSTILLAFAK